MRSTFSLIAAALVLVASAKADVLYNAPSLKVLGTYTQATSQDVIATTKPLKIADILVLLNLPDVDASTVKFYYDETTDSYVIAPKGIADGADGTPTATLLKYEDGSITLGKSRAKAISSGDVSVLNGILKGTYSASYSLNGRVETDVYSINAFGTLNSKPTIFRFSIKETYKVVNAN